ncbi:MAG: helix-turn-helix domain-containing protein [Bradyrhizobium sp.]|uniref:PucR family transcriptional regulator n=1 Tax=Bradyrhizobium sp. TaxID=376 RepID=UPI0027306435|nr:helix-turn-helix domain-containing protein [Bradyrhizobium sp.]MDP1866273.1 helix-turn-helix domain-containing protein [Bradyrhizobium sp.]
MPPHHEEGNRSFSQVLVWLVSAGVLPQASHALRASMQDAGRALRDAVLTEVPAFAASGNPEILPTFSQHVDDHMRQILRLFDGGEVGPFEFVRQHARLRAEQRFPLEAVLHAYRCGHLILSHWIRNAATKCSPANLEGAISAVADFAIEYTNLVSSIATSEYVAHTRLLAQAEGDLRTELLNILLSGYDESDARVARLLRRAGYLDQRQSYCVAVAQPVNAAEMENPARAQRIVNAITDAVAGISLRKLAGVRDNLVTFIFSDRRRQSGWTAPQANLAERLHPLLLTLGPSVLVGISADHPSTSFAPRALHEARIALDFADHANRVIGFSTLRLRSLLVHHGSSYLQSAPPAWASALASADVRAEGILVQTLRAIADADMNVQKAARLLRKHPNTVYARIERIRELTGLDGQRYCDLTELLLAADCWQSGNPVQ